MGPKENKEHRRHQEALQALLDRWEAEERPLDSPNDLVAMDRYVEMLSGTE